MHVFWWVLILFFIGLAEFFIDQYEKLHLSRLKLWPTTLFQALNQYFTFFVNVYAFGTIMDFWDKFRNGIYDFKVLFPYLSYIHGCVVGTSLAVLVYVHTKRKRDRERAIKSLEKARNKKKKMDQLNPEIETEVETIFDEIETEDMRYEIRERAIEKASDIVAEQVERAFKKHPKEDNDVKKEKDNRNTPESKDNGSEEKIPPSSPSSGA